MLTITFCVPNCIESRETSQPNALSGVEFDKRDFALCILPDYLQRSAVDKDVGHPAGLGQSRLEMRADICIPLTRDR